MAPNEPKKLTRLAKIRITAILIFVVFASIVSIDSFSVLNTTSPESEKAKRTWNESILNMIDFCMKQENKAQVCNSDIQKIIQSCNHSYYHVPACEDPRLVQLSKEIVSTNIT